MRFLFSLLTLFAFAADHNEAISRSLWELWGEKKPFTIHKVTAGLTNQNYIVEKEGDIYFVRKSNAQNELLGCSLEREWVAATIASAVGLAPKIRYYLPQQQLMISDFLHASEEQIDLRLTAFQEKFCERLRLLHSLEGPFPEDFCPFACIDSYLKNIREAKAELPAAFAEIILPKVEALRATLSEPPKKVPCHLDLHSRNLVNTVENLYIIDWEYSAMADPLFDLATAPSAEFFSDEEMEGLLRVYLQREPSKQELERFYCMRFLSDVRWGLWCYLQNATSPLDAAFEEFGEKYLQRCLISKSGGGLDRLSTTSAMNSACRCE